MNHKRKLFISEYGKSGNATEAAKKAGYSARTSYSAGHRLLKNVEFVEEIKRLQNEALQKAEITVSEVVILIKEIAVSGKTETNRLRALDMLLKYLGAYADDFKLVSRLTDNEIDQLASRLMNKIEE